MHRLPVFFIISQSFQIPVIVCYSLVEGAHKLEYQEGLVISITLFYCMYTYT
jgi:hypothetical protein